MCVCVFWFVFGWGSGLCMVQRGHRCGEFGGFVLSHSLLEWRFCCEAPDVRAAIFVRLFFCWSEHLYTSIWGFVCLFFFMKNWWVAIWFCWCPGVLWCAFEFVSWCVEICVARTCLFSLGFLCGSVFFLFCCVEKVWDLRFVLQWFFPFLYGDLASFLTRNFMMLSLLGLWGLQRLLLSEQDVNQVVLSYRGEKVRTGVVQSSCGRRRRSRRRRGVSEAAWR